MERWLGLWGMGVCLCLQVKNNISILFSSPYVCSGAENACFQSQQKGQEDGSHCKCLLYKHEEVSSGPRTHAKSGAVLYAWNPSDGKRVVTS